MGMAICAIPCAVCSTAVTSDCGICVHDTKRCVYAKELCAVLPHDGSCKYVYLLDSDSVADDDNMFAIGLSGRIYHGDRRVEDSGCDGDVVYFADVD